jgi:hypothetical protein
VCQEKATDSSAKIKAWSWCAPASSSRSSHFALVRNPEGATAINDLFINQLTNIGCIKNIFTKIKISLTDACL